MPVSLPHGGPELPPYIRVPWRRPPPASGLRAAARGQRGRVAAAPGLSDANRSPLAGRCRAAGSGWAPVAAMMPALAAQRRGCRGLYRLYLRCQAPPLPRACHGESLRARRAAGSSLARPGQDWAVPGRRTPALSGRVS